MQKRNLLLLVFVVFLFSCNKESSPNDLIPQKDPISHEAITKIVEETLREGNVNHSYILA